MTAKPLLVKTAESSRFQRGVPIVGTVWGTFWGHGRGGWGERLRDPTADLVHPVGPQIRVQVERDPRAGMAEDDLQRLRVGARRDRHGRVRVTERMHGDARLRRLPGCRPRPARDAISASPSCRCGCVRLSRWRTGTRPRAVHRSARAGHGAGTRGWARDGSARSSGCPRPAGHRAAA